MKTEPSHADILARLAEGNQRFTHIDATLEGILDSLKCLPVLSSDMADAKRDIAETRDIVEAWAAVKVMGRFVKWSAGIIAALTAIVFAVKTGLAQVLK